ncbi:TonB-dependent receptor plug domain-containing protein, partial [Gemmatimonadota bacterium]
VVTREAIFRSGAATLWEALRLCKTLQLSLDRNGNPVAMIHRGSTSLMLDDTPLIFIDGTRVIDLASLPLISAGDVALIRILSASEASTRYGLGADNGVIEVQTIHR